MSFGIKSVGAIPLNTNYAGVLYPFSATYSLTWNITSYVVKPLNVYWLSNQSYVYKPFSLAWEINFGLSLDFSVAWQTTANINKLFSVEWSTSSQQEVTNNAFKVAPVNRAFSPACVQSNKSPCDDDNN